MPRVANQTPIYILQHPREARHPIGTARIAQVGLELVQLHEAGSHDTRGVSLEFPVPEGTAVLYPGEGALALEHALENPATRPKALIVLDATWSCAKALWRENPWLHQLPKVALTPAQPGNYRIRKEPAPHCLATIEAIVAALEVIEPQTKGLDGLLVAFQGMVDRHLQLRSATTRGGASGMRTRVRARPRQRQPLLERALDKLVLVYCEGRNALPGEPTRKVTRRGRGHDRPLLRVSAVRLGTWACVDLIAEPPTGPWTAEAIEQIAVNLRHAQIPTHALTAALTRDEFRARWSSFLQPDDTLVAWNRRNFELYRPEFDPEREVLSLKGCYRAQPQAIDSGSLDLILEREGSASPSAQISDVLPFGRAGERLASAIQLLQMLRERPGRS